MVDPRTASAPSLASILSCVVQVQVNSLTNKQAHCQKVCAASALIVQSCEVVTCKSPSERVACMVMH